MNSDRLFFLKRFTTQLAYYYSKLPKKYLFDLLSCLLFFNKQLRLNITKFTLS